MSNKEESLSGLLKKLKLEWIWLKLSYAFQFAHHPLCEYYENQRFQIGSIHLCQGCTLVTLGAISSFLLLSLLGIVDLLSFTLMIIYALTSIVIIAIIDGFGLSRFWKRIARFVTGAGIGTAITIILFYDVLWIKVLSVIALIVSYQGYKIFREMKPSTDLCINCPNLHDKPVCPGFINQFEANQKYQDIAYPLLYSDIEQRVRDLTGNDPNYQHSASEEIEFESVVD